MALTREEVEREALALPDEDRIALSERLLLSIRDRAGIDAAWDAEIARRISEIDSGKVKGIAHDEVMGRLRAKYGW